MKNRIKSLLVNRSKKTLAAMSVVSVLAIGSGALAIQQAQTSGAEEVPQIVKQVNDHENRIGTLETRADDTDTKVEQNTSNITVLQQQAGIEPSAPVERTPQGTTPEASPTPEAPDAVAEPPKDPRMITAVNDSTLPNGLRACDYTLHDSWHDSRQGTVRQPMSMPCMSVGEVLPY